MRPEPNWLDVPHGIYVYEKPDGTIVSPADGEKKIAHLPEPVLANIKGQDVAVAYGPAPEQFRSKTQYSYNPPDPSFYIVDPATGICTAIIPDAPKDYTRVVWPVLPDNSDGKPGYDSDPKTNPLARWIAGFDGPEHDPIYGEPPADQKPVTKAYTADQFTADQYALTVKFVAASRR